MSLYEFFRTTDADYPAITAHRQAVAGHVVVFPHDFSGRLYQTMVKPHRDSRGEVVGCIGIAQDVTERALMEGKLRDQYAPLIAAQEIQSYLLPKKAPLYSRLRHRRPLFSGRVCGRGSFRLSATGLGRVRAGDRLIELVQTYAHYAADDIITAVYQDAQQFTGDDIFEDDVTLVVLKVQ